MTRNEEKELIKAFAFGFSAERAAEECEISVEEAVNFKKTHTAEIKAKRSECHE